MRLALAVSMLAAGLVVPPAASAQQVTSFAELPLRINRDDQVRVWDQSGARVTGRVVSFGRDGLTIQAEGGPRQFSDAAVRRLDRSGSSAARGALYGTGAFVLVGAAICNHSPVGAACPFLVGAMFGAPLGALVGAWVPSMHPVYRASVTSGPGRGVASGATRTSLMYDLGMEVNLGDRLIVESVSGETVKGWLERLGDDGFSLSVTAQAPKDYSMERVRRVSVVHGHKKLGTLLGFIGFTALCLPGSGGDWDIPLVFCGLPGAGVGAIIGSAMRGSTVVYPAPAARLTVAPAMLRNRPGVRLSYRF